jgi:hypothetical protein
LATPRENTRARSGREVQAALRNGLSVNGDLVKALRQTVYPLLSSRWPAHVLEVPFRQHDILRQIGTVEECTHLADES